MREMLYLIMEMAPYLLLGFLLAGIMHAFVPASIYKRFLGGNDFKSVLYAAMLGVPLPLCSCGVIPTAMSLRKEGASKGATISFLIATPQTGVDSIIATYSLMGLPFALLRPVAALVTAIFGGTMMNLWVGKTPENCVEQSSGGNGIGETSFIKRIFIALRYAYVDMMQDIGRWLLLGLVVAGIITVFVPESFFALFSHSSILSILFVLLLAIPMYLCATGSIPIAVALMLKGLSPGAALVLLMAGPAANAASVLVVSKVLGKRSVVIYLASLIIGAIVFALAIDYLLPREWFTAPIMAMKSCCAATPGWFNVVCAVMLGLFLVNALIKRYWSKGRIEVCQCHESDGSSCNGVECNTNYKSNNMVVIVEGMSCNHCRGSVERTIAALPGVESVTVDLATKRAEITGSAEFPVIKSAVEALGFEVKPEE